MCIVGVCVGVRVVLWVLFFFYSLFLPLLVLHILLLFSIPIVSDTCAVRSVGMWRMHQGITFDRKGGGGGGNAEREREWKRKLRKMLAKGILRAHSIVVVVIFYALFCTLCATVIAFEGWMCVYFSFFFSIQWEILSPDVLLLTTVVAFRGASVCSAMCVKKRKKQRWCCQIFFPTFFIIIIIN